MDWLCRLHTFKNLASDWSHHCFGNIFHSKRRILAHLEGIDRRLINNANRGIQKLRCKLWQDLQNILDQEEMI